MMRTVLAVFLVLFIGICVFPQEVIKEKVEITPKSTKNNNFRSTTSINFSGSLKIQSDWQSSQWLYTYPDGTTFAMMRVKYQIFGPCDNYNVPIETDWDYVGNMSFSLEPVTATTYQIIPLVDMRSLSDPNQWGGQAASMPFKVFVDGEEYLSTDKGSVISPWFGDISFKIDNQTIVLGDWAFFQGQRLTQPMCRVIGNIKKDFITYTIEQGSQYVSFYNYFTNQDLGDSYIDLNDNPFGIEIRYDNQYYGNEDYTVIVKADVHGYSKTQTLKIKAKPLICKENTIICNNFQPQVLDNNAFNVLGENQSWTWIDKNGIQQTTNTGCGCKYHLKPGTRFGITYPLFSIGDQCGSSQLPVYNFADDITLSLCLDSRDIDNKKWLITIDNLRIPIFTSFCPEMPNNNGWKDLNDGTDYNLLTQNISGVNDLGKIMEALQWWHRGSYFDEKYSIPLKYKYYFSAGIIAHENVHVAQLKDSITYYMNNSVDGFQLYRNDPWLLKQSEYPCPETARERLKKQFATTIKGQIMEFSGKLNYTKSSEKFSESEFGADVKASREYLVIKSNILNWAQKQPWWDNNDIECTQWLSNIDF